MANKWDLKSVIVTAVGDEAPSAIGSKIPEGKTRFVTYIRTRRIGANKSCLTAVDLIVASVPIASAASSTSLALTAISAGKKLVVNMPKVTGATNLIDGRGVTEDIPNTPSLEHPIMSVTGEGWLAAIKTTAGAALSLFVNYYDE